MPNQEEKVIRGLIVFFINLCFMIPNVFAAEKNNAMPLFQHIFSVWTDAFNRKDLAGSCDLFSVHVEANYQGAPRKNYESICNGFKKVFQENRDYKYHFKLHQVYHSNDMASIRVTWYLQIYKHGKVISRTVDEGLDVFQRDKEGRWKIIYYLAYPSKSS